MLFKTWARVILFLLAVILVVWMGYLFAHEGAHDALQEESRLALACFGATAFTPDLSQGEGTILFIVNNVSDYRIRLKDSGVFKNTEPIHQKHCIKRFLKAGAYEFSLEAYEFHTYPWLKPLREWFAVGDGNISVALPDQPNLVAYLEITTMDIRAYRPIRYFRENWFAFFSIASLYFLTILAAAAVVLTIWRFRKIRNSNL